MRCSRTLSLQALATSQRKRYLLPLPPLKCDRFKFRLGKANIDKNYKEIWHLPTSLSVLLYFWPLHPNCWLPQVPSFQGQGIVDLRTDSDLIDHLIELPTPLHERQGEARCPSIDILTERNQGTFSRISTQQCCCSNLFGDNGLRRRYWCVNIQLRLKSRQAQV